MQAVRIHSETQDHGLEGICCALFFVRSSGLLKQREADVLEEAVQEASGQPPLPGGGPLVLVCEVQGLDLGVCWPGPVLGLWEAALSPTAGMQAAVLHSSRA